MAPRFRERGDDARTVEPVVAELLSRRRTPGEEHWDKLAVASLERRIGIDVDDIDRRRMRRGDRPDCGEHLIAEVAIRAREQREFHSAARASLLATVELERCKELLVAAFEPQRHRSSFV